MVYKRFPLNLRTAKFHHHFWQIQSLIFGTQMQENRPTVSMDISSQVLAFLFVFLDLNSEKKEHVLLELINIFPYPCFPGPIGSMYGIFTVFTYIYHKHLTIH